MMSKQKEILLCLLIFFSCMSKGQVKQHEVLESSVQFEIKNAGITVEGRMNGLEALIVFDENNWAETSIKATIDPSTVETGIGIRDKHLKRSDYFDVENYPHIKMVSRKFEKISRNSIEGTFELSIKDVTREIVIPLTLDRDKNRYRMKGNFVLNRLDYDLGEESFIMDEEVKVYVIIISE